MVFTAQQCRFLFLLIDLANNEFNRGPGFYDLLDIFPTTSRFVVDVNFGNNSVDIAAGEIAAAIDYLGWDRIYSIERKFKDDIHK